MVAFQDFVTYRPVPIVWSLHAGFTQQISVDAFHLLNLVPAQALAAFSRTMCAHNEAPFVMNLRQLFLVRIWWSVDLCVGPNPLRDGFHTCWVITEFFPDECVETTTRCRLAAIAGPVGSNVCQFAGHPCRVPECVLTGSNGVQRE